MGNSLARNDFFWSYTDEPHATRRREIIAKYPKIKELYGHDTLTKYIVVWWVLSQVVVSYLLRNSSWQLVVFCAYTYGAVAAHALFLAMHEISHNLAFSKPMHNKFLGVFANLVTIFPHFSMFQRYHMEHHQYQGVDAIDADIPTPFEGKVFRTVPMKLLYVFFQALAYVFRPLYVKPKKPGLWEFINWSACGIFAISVYNFFGEMSLIYLALSSFLSSGLHPIAGHFIAEHYVWLKMQETYSYYGPLNYVTFNVGYHNEHHDFPRVPWSKLPILREMAPEYYKSLPCHVSWAKVMFDFITDATVGPFSRVKRSGNSRTKIEAKDY